MYLQIKIEYYLNIKEYFTILDIIHILYTVSIVTDGKDLLYMFWVEKPLVKTCNIKPDSSHVNLLYEIQCKYI